MCIRLLSLKSLTSTINVWLHNDITNHWWIGEACIDGPVNARVRSPHRKAQADEREMRERIRNKDIGNYFILMLTLSWVGLWDCISPILERAPETLILGGIYPALIFLDGMMQLSQFLAKIFIQISSLKKWRNYPKNWQCQLKLSQISQNWLKSGNCHNENLVKSWRVYHHE